MIRKAFKMSVEPTQHEEYERRHNPIWPELQAVLTSHGVHNYSIFLDEESSQLFGCVEIEDEDEWQAIAETQAAFLAECVDADGGGYVLGETMHRRAKEIAAEFAKAKAGKE